MMQEKTEKRLKLKWANSNVILKQNLFTKSSRMLRQLLGSSICKIAANHNVRVTDICRSGYEWKRAQAITRHNLSQSWMR
jgi:hypothetical protein